MPKCVNHVLGMFRKLSVDKLNSMIRNGFRASPADHPWPSMADPRTIGKRVGGDGARHRCGAVRDHFGKLAPPKERAA
jgi:hypothetical protein